MIFLPLENIYPLTIHLKAKSSSLIFDQLVLKYFLNHLRSLFKKAIRKQLISLHVFLVMFLAEGK